jgi:hypothetical protein
MLQSSSLILQIKFNPEPKYSHNTVKPLYNEYLQHGTQKITDTVDKWLLSTGTFMLYGT